MATPRFVLKLTAGAASASLVAALVKRFQADSPLPKAEIEALARAYRGTSEGSPPLLGYTAVVTGATAGLGMALSDQLLSMGATVVLVSRSKSKLEGVVAELSARHPASGGTLDFEVADLSDLEATGKAGARIVSRYEAIDLLVNNAGIHYSGDMFKLGKRYASPQGYDFSFAANYLGHFLLTKTLEKRLRATAKSRVLQVSSTYHWQGDASQLWPVASTSDKRPLAARVEFSNKLSKFRHMNLAYGNSKLAQILHARALQRAWGGPERGPRVVCACPSWAKTEIIPKNPLGKFIAGFAFSTEYGLNSLLGAIFFPASKFGSDGDFVGNSNVPKLVKPKMHLCSWLASVTTLRDYLGHVLLMLMMLYQRLTAGRFVQRTSPESYNVRLQDELYDWSERAVSPYCPP